MRIYTRRGDHGETSLADGSRTAKNALRIESYGAVDEANSFVGLARAAVTDPLLNEVLHFAQQRLLNCSASLASPMSPPSASTPGITAGDVTALEASVDRFEALSGTSAGFVIEGGSDAAARLHVARAVVRRAERRAVALSASEPVDDAVLAFLNRLSDTLFAAARYANVIAGEPEGVWEPDSPLPTLGQ